MTKILLSYLKELACFAKGKMALNFLLVVILGLLEGAGLVLLLPLLAFAGVSSGPQAGTSGLENIITGFFRAMGVTLTLPLALAFYTVIITGQSYLQRCQMILSTTIQETFDSHLGYSLYRSLAFARWAFFLTVRKADVAHVLTTERARVSMGTYYLLQLATVAVIAVMQVVIAFVMAPYLTLLVIGSGLALFCGLHIFVREARRMGMNISSLTGDLFSQITEHLNGIKEIKSYGIEAAQVTNFLNHRKKVEQTFIDFAKVQSQTDMLYKVGAAAFISIFYYAAVEVFQLSAQIFLVILVIFARLWPRFSAFQGGLQYVVMMLPAFEAVTRLRTCFLNEGEKVLPPGAGGRIELRTGIRFAGVSFRYHSSNGRYALEDVTMSIPARSTTALVGVSGAGKSTLADLLTGLIRPERGEIWVDGVQLNENNIHMWRQSIGYVPQEAFLFNASIRENLTWVCPCASEEEMWEALRLAAIDDFVGKLPGKLDTVVGDRGTCLSGGERQRIVLARALLRKPAFLILDEATSALDTENERRIQQAIRGLKGKLTILIIAHRGSTIENADMVLVLENGKIIEQGSYQYFAANQNSRFHQLACFAR
jgi:ATP-binding cassette subfamily C protein